MNQVISYAENYGQSQPPMVTKELYSRKSSMASTKQHDMPYIGQSRLESIRNQIQKRLIEEKDRKLNNILQQQQQHQHQLLQNHVKLKSLNVYKDIKTVRAFFAQKRTQDIHLNQQKTLPTLDNPSYHSDPSIRHGMNQNNLQPNTWNNKRHKQKGFNSRHNQDNIIGDNHKLNDNINHSQQQHQHANDKINRSHPLPPIQANRKKHDNSRKRQYIKNNNQEVIQQENQSSYDHNSYHENNSSVKRSDQNNDDDELDDLNLGHIKNIRRKKLKREIIRRLSSRQLIQQDASNMSIDSGGESNMPVDDTASGRNSSNLQFSTRPEVTTVTSYEMNDITGHHDQVMSPHPPEKPKSISRRKHSRQRNVFDNAVKTVDRRSEVDRDSILDRQSKASFAMISHGDIESRQQTPDSRLDVARLKTPEVKITSQNQDDQVQMDHQPTVISSYKLPDNIDNDQSDSITLIQCQTCGRKFAADRLEKHQKICKKASTKKRPVFDTSKHRNQGTDNESYAKRVKNQPSSQPKKSNWRIHHNNFIQSIRAAKAMEAHVANGGKLADLPPPPPTENPDYIQCPHCQRKFNQTAAERHIPKCKDIKSRPAPIKRQIKRQFMFINSNVNFLLMCKDNIQNEIF